MRREGRNDSGRRRGKRLLFVPLGCLAEHLLAVIDAPLPVVAQAFRRAQVRRALVVLASLLEDQPGPWLEPGGILRPPPVVALERCPFPAALVTSDQVYSAHVQEM